VHIQPSVEDHYDVTFTWVETDTQSPAKDVLVRMVAVTDDAHDNGDIRPYLMSAQPDGRWSLTVRLPSRLRTSYQLCPVRDEPVRSHPSQERFMEILGMGLPDPRNPATLTAGTTYGNRGPASILELPSALPQPWLARRPSSARGTMTRHLLGSGPDEPAVVHVYVPPSGRSAGLPLAILFDGGCWLGLGVADMFDNLIVDRVVPPFVAVAIESIQGASRQRSLTHPDVFEPFLTEELLPWMHQQYAVSTDPAHTILAGQSLGGLTCAYAARSHPDRFGWVIGQSTSVWWPGDGQGGLSGQQVLDAYATGAHLPIRFFLEVGSHEGELLHSVRSLRDVLAQRHYTVRYREYEGGHDYACWQGGLADGLIVALHGPA
jgi:enterochelin esterase-like enzyme